jgi:hypothetical protein
MWFNFVTTKKFKEIVYDKIIIKSDLYLCNNATTKLKCDVLMIFFKRFIDHDRVYMPADIKEGTCTGRVRR